MEDCAALDKVASLVAEAGGRRGASSDAAEQSLADVPLALLVFYSSLNLGIDFPITDVCSPLCGYFF